MIVKASRSLPRSTSNPFNFLLKQNSSHHCQPFRSAQSSSLLHLFWKLSTLELPKSGQQVTKMGSLLPCGSGSWKAGRVLLVAMEMARATGLLKRKRTASARGGIPCFPPGRLNQLSSLSEGSVRAWRRQPGSGTLRCKSFLCFFLKSLSSLTVFNSFRFLLHGRQVL